MVTFFFLPPGILLHAHYLKSPTGPCSKVHLAFCPMTVP